MEPEPATAAQGLLAYILFRLLTRDWQERVDAEEIRAELIEAHAGELVVIARAEFSQADQVDSWYARARRAFEHQRQAQRAAVTAVSILSRLIAF